MEARESIFENNWPLQAPVWEHIGGAKKRAIKPKRRTRSAWVRRQNKRDCRRKYVLFCLLLSGGLVSNAWIICLSQGDNRGKLLLIPHKTTRWHHQGVKGVKSGDRWVCVSLVSWRGKSPPRRRWLADLRGWPATLGLRYGPDSYGRQQLGILGNGGNSDPATPREGRRFSDCKLLI